MDQAESLRRKVKERRSSRLLTITSGKGGVGKSNIAVNLAIFLSRMGYRTVIVDADLGLGNVDVIMGLNPRYNLSDVIRGEKSILDIMVDGPGNVKVVPAGSGIEELADIKKEQLDFLIQNFLLLDYCADYVIVDTGAGISEMVRKFVCAADEPILVVTPEPTSITDGYALIKSIRGINGNKVFSFIVNRVESPREGQQIAEKLSGVVERFLSMDIKNLGYILDDKSVVKSIKAQEPLAIGFPKSNAARCIYDIALKVANITESKSGGIKRLLSFFRKEERVWI
ncbi:flagellar biosynthesis protein FlhG [Caldanaerobius fijiensis DSM 17918]|uniref:Flagellar biosynthesis protein FlhG n=1 Tax=Caldanaerobius fijiensis DSM 17918 TaxID=1121256 RepID=A0A1M4XLI8_9THEO|nr:MinD/ParA family protein [Caldanaerobius fijiensis]SHE94042.1 flagellar biosynthesis protein FlhG [Caldanaerobius fijiensis DSM 17918]